MLQKRRLETGVSPLHKGQGEDRRFDEQQAGFEFRNRNWVKPVRVRNKFAGFVRRRKAASASQEYFEASENKSFRPIYQHLHGAGAGTQSSNPF